jgi:hypothetical protein
VALQWGRVPPSGVAKAVYNGCVHKVDAIVVVLPQCHGLLGGRYNWTVERQALPCERSAEQHVVKHANRRGDEYRLDRMPLLAGEPLPDQQCNELGVSSARHNATDAALRRLADRRHR